MRVLIVEDNPVNRTLLKANLKKRGYQTIQAENGKHALGILEHTEEPIDVIVTDVMMPEMDGFKMTEQIKNHPEWHTIPVIMCSAMSGKEAIERAMQLGCKHYVLKPIKMQILFSKLEDVLIEDSSELLGKLSDMDKEYDEEIAREIAVSFSSLIEEKIKFLEDQVVDEASIQISKKFADLKEAAECFGANWINKILNRLEEIQQETDGHLDSEQYFRLLQELQKLHSMLPKADLEDEEINTEEQIEDFRKCIERYNPEVLIKFNAMVEKLGYIKPKTMKVDNVESGMVAFDDVWASVGRLLIARGQEVNPKMMTGLKRFAENSRVVEPFRMVSFDELLDIKTEKPADTKTEKSKSAIYQIANQKIKDARKAEEPPIDVKTALEVVGGDKNLYQELMQDFLKSFPNQLEEINDSISKGDVNTVKKHAHDLRDTASNLGVHRIVQYASTLGERTKDGNISDMEAITQQMKDEIAEVMVYFFGMDWENK